MSSNFYILNIQGLPSLNVGILPSCRGQKNEIAPKFFSRLFINS